MYWVVYPNLFFLELSTLQVLRTKVLPQVRGTAALRERHCLQWNNAASLQPTVQTLHESQFAAALSDCSFCRDKNMYRLEVGKGLKLILFCHLGQSLYSHTRLQPS